MQYKGIGRAMKVGKENIMGLLKAIELYDENDNSKEVANQREAMKWLSDELNKIEGIKASIVQDEAGREIYRAQIKVEREVLGVDAYHVIGKLEEGNPAIYTRNHYANIGIINVDPRPLGRGEERVIFERIEEIVKDIN